MFPSGAGWPSSALPSQPAQTPTGHWQPLASTAVGLIDPLVGSTSAAITVAPLTGSGSSGVASWMVPTAPAPQPPVDPWANVAVPSLEDKAAIAREKNRIAQRRWAGRPGSGAGPALACRATAATHPAHAALTCSTPAHNPSRPQVPREGATPAGGGATGGGHAGGGHCGGEGREG